MCIIFELLQILCLLALTQLFNCIEIGSLRRPKWIFYIWTWRYFWINLDVFRSLSWIKHHSHTSVSDLYQTLSSWHPMILFFFGGGPIIIIPSTPSKVPVTFAEKHPQSMTLFHPCFYCKDRGLWIERLTLTFSNKFLAIIPNKVLVLHHLTIVYSQQNEIALSVHFQMPNEISKWLAFRKGVLQSQYTCKHGMVLLVTSIPVTN